MRSFWILQISFVLLLGCATPVSHQLGAISEDDYWRLAKSLTRTTSQYDGFNQTFRAGATLLTTELQTAALARRADFQQWDSNRMQQERDRTFQEASATSKVFIRYYTPVNDYDDLHLPKSIWKIYLEVDGKRYDAQISKSKEKLIELMNLYPDYDRFSTGYEAEFKIPTSALSGHTVKMIMSSSFGKAEFSF